MLIKLQKVTFIWRKLKRLSLRFLFFMGLVLSLLSLSEPALAADEFVETYLAKEPIPLKINEQGDTQIFTPEDLSQGKALFIDSCVSCHVGGATLPDPNITLSLEDLAGATPPRDNVGAIAAFLRNPTTYDGTDISFWCRQLPENEVSDEKVENVSAFILRAAQNAPKWGKAYIER